MNDAVLMCLTFGGTIAKGQEYVAFTSFVDAIDAMARINADFPGVTTTYVRASDGTHRLYLYGQPLGKVEE